MLDGDSEALPPGDVRRVVCVAREGPPGPDQRPGGEIGDDREHRYQNAGRRLAQNHGAQRDDTNQKGLNSLAEV